MPPAIDILYEDGPVLVVNKPGGLLTQAPLGIDNLEVRVKRFLKEREGKEGNIYLAVLHRLDRPVSGAIAFTRHVRAARRISEQFESRMVEKTYWALVPGAVEPTEGTWTDYLQKLDGQARSIVVPPNDPNGRIAVLHYRVAQAATPVGQAAQPVPVPREDGPTADAPPASAPNDSTHASWTGKAACPTTLLEIMLETGRTHQIRVQCASRGYPLLGDEQYGSTVPFGPPSDDPRNRLIALHARTLKFRHPMTREPVEVIVPLPAYWPRIS